MLAEIGSQVVRRWFALVGAAVTLASVAAFAITNRRSWAWLAIAGLVLLVAALLWALRDSHRALSATRPPDSRAQLKPRLEAAAERLRHLGLSPAHQNPKWFLDQYAERHNATYCLIDQSLGPKLADDFSNVHVLGTGLGQMQAEAVEKAVYVDELVAKLDSLPLMGDWEP